MAVKIASRITDGKDKAVLKVHNHHAGGYSSNKVCAYWLAGKCNRNPCRFLHRDHPSQFTYNRNSKQSHGPPEVSLNGSLKLRPMVSISKDGGSRVKNTRNNQQKVAQKNKVRVCEYWLSDTCVYGEKCRYLHSWFHGDGFTRLTLLEGHKKAITGIALPSGSDKLYSGCTDGSVRVLDCNTGKCASVINVGGEVGSLISEGPWVFVGMPNVVKALNIQTSAEHNLTGPVGQVYAMIVGKDKLFAGTEDGAIVVWKSGSESDPFQFAASLKGHTRSVVSLTVGANKLYSGSMDLTIKVWDIDILQCVMTLNGHSEVVTSLLCWEEYLLSGSLDGTIKAWALKESGDIEVIYTHDEDNGVLALCGMHDSEAKPILFCSCNDNSVRLYDLPSFSERGRLFSEKEVKSIQIAPSGHFFTGDGTGRLGVWKWLAEPCAEKLHE